MEPHAADRRVRRTKALLRQALASLLRLKPVQNITVTELTRLADVNRGTFYCHYKDVYDLVDQLQQEVFDQFTTLLDTYTAEDLRPGLHPILRDIFTFIDRNADVCAAFFHLDQESSFLQRLKSLVHLKVSREWGQLYGLDRLEEGEYCLSFLVAGVIGLLQAWASRPNHEPPNQMAGLAERLILNGLAGLPHAE